MKWTNPEAKKMMPTSFDLTITTIFGKTKTGKTWYMKNLIRKSIIPCIVIDTQQEYGDVAQLQNVRESLHFKYFKTRFIPDDEREFDIVNQIIATSQIKYGMNIFYDEIDFWTSPNFMPRSFLNNLRYHRHRKLNIFCSVRTPSELNKKISGLSRKFVIFRLSEPLHLDYFRRYNPTLPDQILALNEGIHEKIIYVP